MSDNDLAYLEEKPKKLQFSWLLPIFYKPRNAMEEIAEKNHAVWLAPLIILMVSAMVLILVSAPIVEQASQVVTQSEAPAMNENSVTEQQGTPVQEAGKGANPVKTMVFPLLGKVAGIWIGWFLLSSILHLSLTLNGCHSNNRSTLNVTAWATMPYVLRDIVQIMAILVTNQLISKPGLSGFIADGATGFPAYFASVLLFIDVYFIWQVALMGIGAANISGKKPAKVWLATLIAVVVFLAIIALPGFIGAQLGALSTGGV
jgi:hypothetical protein